MNTSQELEKTIGRLKELMTWLRGNEIVQRHISCCMEDATVIRRIELLLEREVPERPDPAYVDQVYEGVRALLVFHQVLKNVVRPQLEEALRRADDDRVAIRMTLSSFGDNLRRVVDAAADLYVGVSRWLGLPAATEQIRTRFRELSDPETWNGS